jgi:hypothetical protein
MTEVAPRVPGTLRYFSLIIQRIISLDYLLDNIAIDLGNCPAVVGIHCALSYPVVDKRSDGRRLCP